MTIDLLVEAHWRVSRLFLHSVLTHSCVLMHWHVAFHHEKGVVPIIIAKFWLMQDYCLLITVCVDKLFVSVHDSFCLCYHLLMDNLIYQNSYFGKFSLGSYFFFLNLGFFLCRVLAPVLRRKCLLYLGIPSSSTFLHPLLTMGWLVRDAFPFFIILFCLLIFSFRWRGIFYNISSLFQFLEFEFAVVWDLRQQKPVTRQVLCLLCTLF